MTHPVVLYYNQALEPRASFQAYAARVGERPAYKRADAGAAKMMQQR